MNDSSSPLAPHLKGHVFLFDSPRPPAFDAAAGLRLLAIFGLLEIVLGPRLWLLKALGVASPPAWVRVAALLALALLLVHSFARLTPAQIGLRRWREWTLTEKSYFLQVLLIANVVFGVLFAGQLRRVAANSGLWGFAALLVGTNLLWGFYQELVYRGLLQSELVRRWGAVAGILVANLAYTFGPLHFYHLTQSSPARAAVVLGGTFAIGLFFGVLFRRTGNLAMVGVFHGIGNAWIVGLGTFAP